MVGVPTLVRILDQALILIVKLLLLLVIGHESVSVSALHIADHEVVLLQNLLRANGDADIADAALDQQVGSYNWHLESVITCSNSSCKNINKHHCQRD